MVQVLIAERVAGIADDDRAPFAIGEARVLLFQAGMDQQKRRGIVLCELAPRRLPRREELVTGDLKPQSRQPGEQRHLGLGRSVGHEADRQTGAMTLPHSLQRTGQHMVSLVKNACQIEKYAADHSRRLARSQAPIQRARVADPSTLAPKPCQTAS